MKAYDELKQLIDQRGVHAVFGEQGEGWAIEQNSAELAEFLVVCQELGVSSVLEIGTGYKAGLARFLHDDLGWKVTSVDIKDYGHQFGGIEFVHPLDFDHALIDEAFDLVIIDGDHTYEGVKNDHERYAPYATKVIAFHDIAGLRDCEGVEQYWNELRIKVGYVNLERGYFHEIIAEGDQRGGIGYIVLSEVQDEPEQLLSPEAIAKLKPVVDEAVEKLAPAKPKPTPRKRTPAKKPAAKTVSKATGGKK